MNKFITSEGNRNEAINLDLVRSIKFKQDEKYAFIEFIFDQNHSVAWHYPISELEFAKLEYATLI